MTAAEATAAAAAPGMPPVPTPEVAASTQMVGMAVKQLTAGWSVTGDVWAGIHAGVAALKPHKAHVRPCLLRPAGSPVWRMHARTDEQGVLRT